MQVFELYFNPKAKKTKILDTFYYRPKNLYENRLGDLLMVGELNNPISKESYFLKNLANAIKGDFYGPKIFSPAKNLRKALKTGNVFLEKVIKNGDVSWLSNLNFTILSFARSKKTEGKYIFNFTRVGKMGVLLIHDGQVLDIGKKLDGQEIEPYPLKIFSNIVSGVLERDDKVLVLTEKIYKSPVLGDLLNAISQLPFLDEKAINQVLKDFRGNLAGLCFLIHLAPDAKKQTKQKIIFKQRFLIERLNLKPLFSAITVVFASLKKRQKSLKNSRYLKFLDFEFGQKIIPGKLFKCMKNIRRRFMLLCNKLAKFNPKKSWYAIKHFVDTKKIVLVIGLGVLLLAGHFITKIEDKRELMEVEEQFHVFEEEIKRANLSFNLGRTEEANELFLEARKKGELLSKNKSPLLEEIFRLQSEIENKLFEINKLTIINNPELFFEFDKTQPLPQKIVLGKNKIYAFGSYFNGFFQLNMESGLISESTFHENKRGFSGATLIENGIAFFSEPEQIFMLDNNALIESLKIGLSFEDQELEYLCSFLSNLYFWDGKTGQVIKYSWLVNGREWGEPEFWLEKRIFSEQDRDVISSMAVDGGVWLLSENGQFDYYSYGSLKTQITSEIFPKIKKVTKIWVSAQLPYIYILEPDQKRIMVFSREGRIVRQYQSPAFDNLKDFTVSEDGTIIYLLNGIEILRINLE